MTSVSVNLFYLLLDRAALEWQSLQAITWSAAVIGLFAAFGICMFLLYTLLPIVMSLSSATTVNISLLTADLYALFAGLFLFHYTVSTTLACKSRVGNLYSAAGHIHCIVKGVQKSWAYLKSSYLPSCEW